MFRGLVVAAACFAAASCSGDDKRPATADDAAFWSHSPPVCEQDEVREYFCDDLLPQTAALPAPAPYDTCPANLEGHVGRIDPTPPVAVFDVDYTDYMRKRAPPGHDCCFSWCSLVTVVDPTGLTGREGCDSGIAFRETFCMDEPEKGTSSPMGAPFTNCPAAISPPEGAVFRSPDRALFDVVQTQSRRARGFLECCYGWCTDAPAGSGLQKR